MLRKSDLLTGSIWQSDSFYRWTSAQLLILTKKSALILSRESFYLRKRCGHSMSICRGRYPAQWGCNRRTGTDTVVLGCARSTSAEKYNIINQLKTQQKCIGKQTSIMCNTVLFIAVPICVVVFLQLSILLQVWHNTHCGRGKHDNKKPSCR